MGEIIVIVLAGIGGLVVLAVVAFFAWCMLDRFRLLRASSVRREAIRERNACLASDSHWFSEHPPTANLIARLANGADVSKAREAWRQEMREVSDA